MKHQPWQDGPFRWRLGLRPLDLADWFEFDGDGRALTERKPDLLARHPGTVVATEPGSQVEGAEVLEAIAAHVARFHPAILDRADERDASGPRPRPGEHPLVAAARLVPDDLLVMAERDGALRCVAGVVCFPNRWDLPSKLGRTMRRSTPRSPG
ncbi:MAG: DUF3445 domain-containing protein [Ilumatobacteraceae bacterium]